MPASISPTKFPEIGEECNEFAFLPGACEDEDGTSLTFLQGSSVPCHLEKVGSLLSSGATTPGEESELEDQSDYEFNATGQEEYYDFLREMGCDFKQAPHDEEAAEDELEEEGDVEFIPDGQEDYYDFLREMGCPFEARATDVIQEEEDEEDWPATEDEVEEEEENEEWNNDTTSAGHCSVASGETMHAPDQESQRFGPYVSITPGPSLILQQVLLNLAAQRNQGLSALERQGSLEMVKSKEFVHSC